MLERGADGSVPPKAGSLLARSRRVLEGRSPAEITEARLRRRFAYERFLVDTGAFGPTSVEHRHFASIPIQEIWSEWTHGEPLLPHRRRQLLAAASFDPRSVARTDRAPNPYCSGRAKGTCLAINRLLRGVEQRDILFHRIAHDPADAAIDDPRLISFCSKSLRRAAARQVVEAGLRAVAVERGAGAAILDSGSTPVRAWAPAVRRRRTPEPPRPSISGLRPAWSSAAEPSSQLAQVDALPAAAGHPAGGEGRALRAGAHHRPT